MYRIVHCTTPSQLINAAQQLPNSGGSYTGYIAPAFGSVKLKTGDRYTLCGLQNDMEIDSEIIGLGFNYKEPAIQGVGEDSEVYFSYDLYYKGTTDVTECDVYVSIPF